MTEEEEAALPQAARSMMETTMRTGPHLSCVMAMSPSRRVLHSVAHRLCRRIAVLDGLIISNAGTNVDDQQALARIPCDQRAPTPAGSLPRDHARLVIIID
jgi:hypothetical protein